MKEKKEKKEEIKYWQPMGKNWCYLTGRPSPTKVQDSAKDKRHDYGIRLTTNINL